MSGTVPKTKRNRPKKQHASISTTTDYTAMATTNYHKAKVRLHTRQSNQPDTRLPLRCLLVPPLSLHSEPRRHKFVHRNLDLRRSTNVHRVLSAAATSKRDHVCYTTKEKDATQCNTTQGTSKQASTFTKDFAPTNNTTLHHHQRRTPAPSSPPQQPTTQHSNQQRHTTTTTTTTTTDHNNKQRTTATTAAATTATTTKNVEAKRSEANQSQAKRSEAK